MEAYVSLPQLAQISLTACLPSSARVAFSSRARGLKLQSHAFKPPVETAAIIVNSVACCPKARSWAFARCRTGRTANA
jgi:hypothetical protein